MAAPGDQRSGQNYTALVVVLRRSPGSNPGSRIRLHGTVGIGTDGHPAMINLPTTS
jgi:hypothetical protein